MGNWGLLRIIPRLDSTLLLYAVAALTVLAGLAGTVLPLLPGTLLVLAGLVVAAWAEDFTRVGVGGIAVIGVLAVFSLGVDLAGSLLGARRVGASPLALVGATAGALVGMLFGIVGLVLGPFAGAVLGELVARKRLPEAAKAGLGSTVGLLLAAIVKVVIAFLMIATFFAFYLLSSPPT